MLEGVGAAVEEGDELCPWDAEHRAAGVGRVEIGGLERSGIDKVDPMLNRGVEPHGQPTHREALHPGGKVVLEVELRCGRGVGLHGKLHRHSLGSECCSQSGAFEFFAASGPEELGAVQIHCPDGEVNLNHEILGYPCGDKLGVLPAYCSALHWLPFFHISSKLSLTEIVK